MAALEEDGQWNQVQHNRRTRKDIYKFYELKLLPRKSNGKLLERIDRFGVNEKTTVGDGNCQMRALSKLLHGKQKHYSSVRTKIVKELRKKPGTYLKIGNSYFPWMTSMSSFYRYVNRMSQDKQWGDFLTLYAAANAYRVRILLFCSLENDVMMEFAPKDFMYKADIFLTYCYVDSNYAHYNAAFLKSGIPHVDKQSPSPSDSPSMLDKLHEKWNTNTGSVKLFVRYGTDGHSLETAFAKHAKVLSVEVLYGDGNRSLGYAIVEMEDEMAANKVMEALDGKILDGRRIYMKRYKSYDDLA